MTGENLSRKAQKLLPKGGCEMSVAVRQELIEEIDALPDDLQRRVLDFARALALSLPKGVPGKRLLSFVHTIPSDDLQRMRQAIEAACEQVDDEW